MLEHNETRLIKTVRYSILGLSAFLVGLYSGTSLSSGIDLVVFQAGLIGLLSFTGLTQVQTRSQVAAEKNSTPPLVRSKQVERRLDRHVRKSPFLRIDGARQPGLSVSVRKSSRTAGAVSTVAKQELIENGN